MKKTIKTLLGLMDDRKDELIETLIDICTDEAKEYCNRDDVEMLYSCIVQMVVFKYNRIGTEGLNSESYSGNSYSYTDTYPDSVLKILNKNRKLKVM